MLTYCVYLQIVYYANMLAGSMESNSLREAPIVINNQQDPLENVLGHLYPPTSMKGSKQSQPDDPLGIVLNFCIFQVYIS